MKKWSRQCLAQKAQQLFPVSIWIRTYTLKKFLFDFAGGVTVGLTAIPQSLAYAQVASLPVQYGLYSTIISNYAYFLFGTARDVNLGPTALISLLTGKQVDETGYHIHQILSFATGIVILALSLLPISTILDALFPVTVTSGFTSAAAVLIVCTQIKYFFGITIRHRDFIHLVPEFITQVTNTNLWDALAGTVTLVFLLGVQYLLPFVNERIQRTATLSTKSKKIFGGIATLILTTRAIFIVLIMTTIAYFLSSGQSADGHNFITNGTLNDTMNIATSQSYKHLTLTGYVPSGPPQPALPPFEGIYRDKKDASNSTRETEFVGPLKLLDELKINIIVIPLISALELLALAKALSQRGGYPIRPSQELAAAGIANLFGSFFNTFPTSASVTRTSLNSQCRVKTPMCSAITASLVLIASVTVADICLPYVPKAVLAGVLIAAATNMVDVHVAIDIWRVNRVDLLPWMITFVACVIVDIEYGVLLGVCIALMTSAVLSHRSFRRHVTETISANTFDNGDGTPVMVIGLPSGELRYPCAEDVKKLATTTSNHFGPVVINCSKTRALDYATIDALLTLTKVGKADTLGKELPFTITGLETDLAQRCSIAAKTRSANNTRPLRIQPDIGIAIVESKSPAVISQNEIALKELPQTKHHRRSQSESALKQITEL